MSDLYRQLIEATIQHLELLKAEGRKFIVVTPSKVAALNSAIDPQKGRVPRRRGSKRRPESARPHSPSPRVQHRNHFSDRAWRQQHQACLSAQIPRRLRWPSCVSGRWFVKNALTWPPPARMSSSESAIFNSPLMFVGEAPGADEDLQGEPFVGKAGQLLTRMIQAMGFTRETVYIANILKCRPDTPGQAYGNRKPTLEEMKTCLPYLLSQVDLIQPKVIVALGATAVEGLFGKTAGITRTRGQFQTFRNIPVMPTYHPAYLLRNQSISEKRKVWEDLLQVMETLGVPISEKQRNYFLKA